MEVVCDSSLHSVWDVDHHWPVHCVRDDRDVRTSFRTGCWCLPCHYPPGMCLVGECVVLYCHHPDTFLVFVYSSSLPLILISDSPLFPLPFLSSHSLFSFSLSSSLSSSPPSSPPHLPSSPPTFPPLLLSSLSSSSPSLLSFSSSVLVWLCCYSMNSFKRVTVSVLVSLSLSPPTSVRQLSGSRSAPPPSTQAEGQSLKVL